MKKRLFALMLAVVSCFALTACGDEGKELYEMNMDKYVQLGEYTNLEVTPVLQEVTDIEVQSQMEYLQVMYTAQQHTTLQLSAVLQVITQAPLITAVQNTVQ